MFCFRGGLGFDTERDTQRTREKGGGGGGLGGRQLLVFNAQPTGTVISRRQGADRQEGRKEEERDGDKEGEKEKNDGREKEKFLMHK